LHRGDTYGERVNIAVRLEGLTEPGGISIPGMVQDSWNYQFGCDAHQVYAVPDEIRRLRQRLLLGFEVSMLTENARRLRLFEALFSPSRKFSTYMPDEEVLTPIG
jgi:class 3 adenylate cyclase